MKIVFFGTPQFAVEALYKLIKSEHELLAVVTQPDKPKGRGQKLIPSPVKQIASDNNIRIMQPKKLVDIKEELERLNADVFVVVAYGKLLPDWILYMAPFKCVNIHPSLLPLYRGAAPIERAIMNGDTKTGVSTMQLKEGMDDGPVYLQEEVEISENENADSLKERLSTLSADLLLRTLDEIAAGSVEATEQDHTKATVIEKLTKEDEKIDWNDTPLNIHNRIRALSTKPGAYTFYKGKRLKILESRIATRDIPAPPHAIPTSPDEKPATPHVIPTSPDEKPTTPHVIPDAPHVIPAEAGIQIPHQVRNDKNGISPGTISNISKDTFEVAASDGGLNILIVQPEGKNPMTASEFIRGYKPQAGEKLA